MTFNTAVIAGVEEYTSWDDVLALSPTNGDRVMFLGMKWKYVGTSAVWLPEDAYNGSPAQIITADGDEADVAALTAKGWNVIQNGSGAVTLDGTYITLHSPSSGNYAQMRKVVTDDGTKHHVLYGLVTITVAPTTNNSVMSFAYYDKTYNIPLGLHMGTIGNYPAFGATVIGKTRTDCTMLNVERFVLFIYNSASLSNNQGSVYAYIQGFGGGHYPTCAVDNRADFGSYSVSSEILVGDNLATNQGTMKVRNFVHASFG